MNVARLIVDPPQSGDWNMAIDEVLLESAVLGVTTLRFYQWSEPTLSLGYFQAYRDRELHPASRDCPCVRRASGGGAILHDCELTYSFAMPVAGPRSRQNQSVCLIFHEGLIAALAGWGVAARLCGERAIEGPTATLPPFLCFQRHSSGDVMLKDRKICGSAQRRRRGALLQHGSVILERSKKAPEIEGIVELTARLLPGSDLAGAWCEQLADGLELRWDADQLAPEEQLAAEKLRSQKYGANDWSVRR